MIDSIQIARDLTAKSSLKPADAEAIVQTIVQVQTAELATKLDIAKLRGEVDILKWMIGVVYALQIAILLKLFLH